MQFSYFYKVLQGEFATWNVRILRMRDSEHSRGVIDSKYRSSRGCEDSPRTPCSTCRVEDFSVRWHGPRQVSQCPKMGWPQVSPS